MIAHLFLSYSPSCAFFRLQIFSHSLLIHSGIWSSECYSSLTQNFRNPKRIINGIGSLAISYTFLIWHSVNSKIIIAPPVVTCNTYVSLTKKNISKSMHWVNYSIHSSEKVPDQSKINSIIMGSSKWNWK